MKQAIINTTAEKCMGCNKCIAKCPVNANEAKLIDGQNKIFIHQDRCIQCAECIRVCDHEARYFEDDTVEFLDRLKNGGAVSLLAAPAIRNGISEYQKLFGYLKKAGVRTIYDVSFGADITTWAYLKAIKEKKRTSMIAQPCPVIVSYIQKYQADLIPYLAPVQSPAVCAAIYLKKYKHVTDDLAFLSPCIGKATEFSDDNTNGAIRYNVTISNLMRLLKERGHTIQIAAAADFDNRPADLGFAFSRPGGLRENVAYYAGEDAWVKQVEGIGEVCEYLDLFESRIRAGKHTPLLVDALNCKHGCNLGTAMHDGIDMDDVDIRINQEKQKFLNRNPDPSESQLFRDFDRDLNWDDFSRVYTNHSMSVQDASESEIEEAFVALGKITEESRHINCFACGYGSCLKFAQAVASGNNDVRNCINYSRAKLRTGREEFDELFDQLEERILHTNEQLQSLRKSAQNLDNIAKQTKIISINASIESVNAGQFGRGFAVVASEIKSLAGKSEDLIRSNQDNQETLMKNIQAFEKFVEDMKIQIDNVLQ